LISLIHSRALDKLWARARTGSVFRVNRGAPQVGVNEEDVLSPLRECPG
jgi:hypothetical protein